MLDLIADPVFKVYVGSTIILAMNLMVLANNTALSRARASEVINPEDKKLNPKGTVVFEEGNEKTQRYQRAHRNALENVPLFIMTSLLLPLTGVSVGVAAGLCGIFSLARIAHSFFYVRSIQPLRTASFGVGALTQVALLGVVAYKVFLG